MPNLTKGLSKKKGISGGHSKVLTSRLNFSGEAGRIVKQRRQEFALPVGWNRSHSDVTNGISTRITSLNLQLGCNLRSLGLTEVLFFHLPFQNQVNYPSLCARTDELRNQEMAGELIT